MTKLLSELVNKARRTKGAIIILDPLAYAHLLTIPGMGDRLEHKGSGMIGAAHVLDKEIKVLVTNFHKSEVTKSKRAHEYYMATVEDGQPIGVLPSGVMPTEHSMHIIRLYRRLRKIIPNCPEIPLEEWTGTDRDIHLLDRAIAKTWISHWEKALK
jgi:hypothetical protein